MCKSKIFFSTENFSVFTTRKVCILLGCVSLTLICFVPAPELVDSSESFVDSAEKEHDYTNIRIDTEGLQSEDTNQPYVAHVQNDAAHLQQVIEVMVFMFYVPLNS